MPSGVDRFQMRLPSGLFGIKLRLMWSALLCTSLCLGLFFVFPAYARLANDNFWPPELEMWSPQANATYQSPVDFLTWQQQAKQRLWQSYLWPKPLPAIQFKRSAQYDEGRYWREHWQVQLFNGPWQEVWLLKPKSATAQTPHPAVLLLHDHGAEFRLGKDKWIKPQTPDKLALAQGWVDRYFAGKFVGEQLVEAGFIVLAADTLGFGARGPIGYEEQQQLASNLLARGYSLAGMAALEDLQLAHFLAQQPEVKLGAISALGFSMGAYRVWQLLALSEHIDAGIGVGWFAPLADLQSQGSNLSRGQSAFYLLHPGLAAQLDLPDIAGLAAPKPLLIVTGGQDKLMPMAAVQRGVERLKFLYRVCNHKAETQVNWVQQTQEGHVVSAASQVLILNTLQQWQQLTTSTPLSCQPAKA